METACVAFGIGCPRSNLDAALLVEYFKKNRLKVTTKFQEADIILVSTCGFGIQTENRSIELLSIVNRLKNKNARVIAFGCLPGINEARIKKEFDITTVTRKTLDKLDSMIGAEVSIRDVREPNDLSKYDFIKKCFHDSQKKTWKKRFENKKRLFLKTLYRIRSGNITYPITRIYKKLINECDDRNVFNLRIATGCNGFCSYCAIKSATGPLNSKPLKRILKEFEDGLSMGYKTFNLVAEDVGAYGQDIGTNIVNLLRELFNNKNKFKLEFSDFSP